MNSFLTALLEYSCLRNFMQACRNMKANSILMLLKFKLVVLILHFIKTIFFIFVDMKNGDLRMSSLIFKVNLVESCI